MVGSILPIVYAEYEERKVGKQAAVILIHTLGCLAGAAWIGSLLGTIGMAIPWHTVSARQEVVTLMVTGAVSALYSTHELGFIRAPVLSSRWQVPRGWTTQLPPKVTALAYGIGLGIGVATAIPVATFYVIIIWAMLVGSPLLGALILAAFGLGRALPLVLMGSWLQNGDESVRLLRVLHRWQPTVHLLNGLALDSAGFALLMTALTR